MRVDLRRLRTNPVWWIRQEWHKSYRGKNAANTAAFLKLVTNKLTQLHHEKGITFPLVPDVHGQINFGDIELGKKRAGSIGLAVKDDLGFVTELIASKAPKWQVAGNLPFREEHAIDTLDQVLKHCAIGNLVPLLQGFDISDSLGERADGGSMDISCLMAIIDEVSGNDKALLSSFVVSFSRLMKVCLNQLAGSKQN